MSSTAKTLSTTRPCAQQQLSWWRTAQAVWVFGLLLAGYWHTILNMAGSWFDESLNMEHGVLVPVLAAYISWRKLPELRQVPVSNRSCGFILVAWGLVQSTVALAGQWVWAGRVAFVVSVTGCVWVLFGRRIVQELAYPLAALLFMIALPTFVNEYVTFHLQLISSRIGEFSLETIGFSVLRDGNILELVGERLAVAEACSGIRSLMSLYFLCLAYCYFCVPSTRLRIALFLAVAPVSIVSNALRIVATGVVGQYDRQLAHGILHGAFGYAGLFAGAMILVLLHRTILRVQAAWPRGVASA